MGSYNPRRGQLIAFRRGNAAGRGIAVWFAATLVAEARRGLKEMGLGRGREAQAERQEVLVVRASPRASPGFPDDRS